VKRFVRHPKNLVARVVSRRHVHHSRAVIVPLSAKCQRLQHAVLAELMWPELTAVATGLGHGPRATWPAGRPPAAARGAPAKATLPPMGQVAESPPRGSPTVWRARLPSASCTEARFRCPALLFKALGSLCPSCSQERLQESAGRAALFRRVATCPWWRLGRPAPDRGLR
jgi:hypothetical protein